MALFPATPLPQYPYDISVVWKTIISAFDSGKEQRRQKQTYAKYDMSLTYNALHEADFQTLWNFYVARKGSFEAFYFYTLARFSWYGLFIWTGDGAIVTFDIPGKSTSAQVIYNNGIVVPGGDYTIVTGGGMEGSDRVTFNTAPVLNAIITCDFTGFMRIRCRFEEDKLTKEAFDGALYRTGLKLKGLAAI
jgi:hypothetical protein